MPQTDIHRESPLGADLTLLFARHRADCHADTPPESIHMMGAAELDAPGIWFFVLRERGVPLAMAAFKQIDPSHAEIKSMHVLAEARGRGLSRSLLAHVIGLARTEGFTRLSLETGIQPTFIAARGLYERAGFQLCPPFGGYVEDPNSIFMTLQLAEVAIQG